MTAHSRSDRRNTATRIGVAALAVLGIGAAITTAAWTDQVWFAADADGKDAIALQGSTTADAGFADAPDAANAISFAVDGAFAELEPGQTRTATVYVKNIGTAEAILTHNVVTDGDLWAAATGQYTATALITDANLAPGEVTPVTVTVTTTADLPVAVMGTTGTITLTVTGTST